MSWQDDAKADIKSDEGLKLESYDDPLAPGVWTVGYGHTGKDVVPGMIIDEPHAENLLAHDFATACADLDEHLSWWKVAPDPVRRGLVNMCFNLGYPRLSGFSHMLACGEMGNYLGMAIAALDSKWARQVKGRAVHIAELFKSASESVGA